MLKFKPIFGLFIIMMFCIYYSYAQKGVDFTYNIISEYNKQLKKFPNIEIVNAINDSIIQESIDIIYNKNNKRPLHLDAYCFKTKERLPALILIHGGGWKSGDKSMLKPLAQTICRNGYQCFAIEYQLSDEAKYPQSIDNILEAIAFLKNDVKRFKIDTLKIGILGCSSGGQMASLIGAKYPDAIQAIVNLDGILAFHHPESKEGILASEWLGGTYEEKPEIWEDASALSHVSKNTPPILFINSQFERFHAGRDNMIQILNQYTIYNQVKQIENSPHTFWLFHPWFNETALYITQFLDKILKSNP